MTVRYLTRAEWGAGPLGSGRRAPQSQFVGLVVHHTVIVMADYDRDGYLHGDLDDIKRYMRSLQKARPDLGDEVPYSFVVFRGARPGDAVVAEGRGLGVTGAHTSGYNSSRYGVAYAGNAENDPITEGVLDGVRWVGTKLTARPLRPTIGHRDTKATACPGKNLYAKLDQLQPPFAAEEDDVTEAEMDKIASKVVAALEKRLDTDRTPIRKKLRELAKLGADDALDARETPADPPG